MYEIHGPTVIPFRNMSGELEGTPHHPGIYARYIPIDLHANNRHAIERFVEEWPDRPRPHLGWGVCRHGFGLQNLPPLTEEQANALSVALNASTPIGVEEAFGDGQKRLEQARVEAGL